MFFRGSRYEHTPDAEIAGPAGRTIRYKRMRFIPQVQGRIGEKVQEGDRPDLVAFRALGDPEQFWRLCDVNRVMAPAELTAVGGQRILSPGPGG